MESVRYQFLSVVFCKSNFFRFVTFMKAHVFQVVFTNISLCRSN